MRDNLILFVVLSIIFTKRCDANEILGCGGFVKSHDSIDFSKIEIGLYTSQGILKEKTECAPNNGYYFLPLYDKGDYILKIHPPAGWSFEPKQVSFTVDGETDPCSSGRDVNFKFNGFGIAGKVLTAGRNNGPAGISIKLISANGEFRETVSTEGGEFNFTPVVPGKYSLRGSHTRWSLDPAESIITVTEGKTELPHGVLVVKGYEVQGTVHMSGNPMSNIHVLLYSNDKNPKLRVEDCKTALLTNVEEPPLCYQVSDKRGVFRFGIVPSGSYYLVVLRQTPGSARVVYKVKPERLPFTVQHDSIYIKDAFQITSLNVLGEIKTSPQSGKPMSGVQVLLNGNPTAVSDTAGRYTLNNINPGTYTLSFQAENCKFLDKELIITSNGGVTQTEVTPDTWKVCGVLTVQTDSSYTVQIESHNQHIHTLRTERDGKWCTYLQNGVYKVSVAESDKKQGVQFFPTSQKLVVSDGSPGIITFSQLKATISGQVKCGSDDNNMCSNVKVTLTQLNDESSQPYVTEVLGGAYKFSNILAGNYEVSVQSDRRCWQNNKYSLLVNKDVVNVPDFIHTGYTVTYTSSHPVEVIYKHVVKGNSAGVSGKVQLVSGVNHDCLPAAGLYQVTIQEGCHRFIPSTIEFNTADASNVIVLNAISHQHTINIISKNNVNDLQLKVEAGSEEIITPIKHYKEGDSFIYEHKIYLAQNELVNVECMSNTSIIKPRGKVKLYGKSDCVKNALVFEATKALVLHGRMIPPTAGVTVSLIGDDETITQTTSEYGTYSFGPLDPLNKYKVTAEKDSYVITGPNSNGDFTLHKLAQIIVKLYDETDKMPLSNVLVSVSGGNYRRNTLSSDDGTLLFGSLAPAEYYVKPLMKENKFQPPHTIINVKEGETYSIEFLGKRVAWSVSGRVVWPSGSGASGIIVKGSSDKGNGNICSDTHTQTDADGDYILRALSPNCDYTISSHSQKKIKTGTKDIKDIDLIAWSPHDLTDITVLVKSSDIEYYKTLKLMLLLADESTDPVYNSKLDSTGFSSRINPGIMLVLPRLQPDNNEYKLVLESSLSKSSYTYNIQEIFFNSDGKYKHFTIEFNPMAKTSELDLNQTSFLVLPLLAVIGLAIFNRDQVLDIVGDYVGNLSDKLLQAASKKTQSNINMQNVLDEQQINQIVQNVNAVNRRKTRKI